MNMSLSALGLEVDHLRKFSTQLKIIILTRRSANLARAGHSVFLIEAGEDNGDARIQQMPSLYATPPAIMRTTIDNFFQR
jgi:hypothetical protein